MAWSLHGRALYALRLVWLVHILSWRLVPHYGEGVRHEVFFRWMRSGVSWILPPDGQSFIVCIQQGVVATYILDLSTFEVVHFSKRITMSG